MIDLIKTFILGIWIEKKYRYLFIFISLTIIYRFTKWLIIFFTFEMSPVTFSSINSDGSIKFIYLKKYEQNVYTSNYQTPKRYGRKNKNYEIKGIVNTKKCEQEFFKQYENAILKLINSSLEKKFIIQFDKKIPKNTGEIIYYNSNNNEKYIYESLYKQGFIFDKQKDVNYCNELKNFK